LLIEIIAKIGVESVETLKSRQGNVFRDTDCTRFVTLPIDRDRSPGSVSRNADRTRCTQ
jgi:hypothetical protein